MTELLRAWSEGDTGAGDRLTRLVEFDPPKSRIAVATVERDWKAARLWLFETLSGH